MNGKGSIAPTSLATIEQAMRSRGLTPRGAFHPAEEDGVPPLSGGRPVASLILAGHAGPEMWRRFQKDAPSGKDPLDRWSRRVLLELAEEFEGEAFFPGDGPPYLPFVRWALRAEAVHVSPLGILIHPDYGLWHGYRGALALDQRLSLPPPDDRPSPCDDCREKPCLSACPVGAISDGGYDMKRCVAHVESADGSDCRDQGCRARRACPVGRAYSYAPSQARFHMAAFLGAHRSADG